MDKAAVVINFITHDCSDIDVFLIHNSISCNQNMFCFDY